jgi:parallel beta-helix repeat protein
VGEKNNMEINSFFRKGLAVVLILLFIGTYIIPSTAQDTEKIASKSGGDLLFVGGDGPGNYTNIQDAVDNSSDGDTIYVFGGTYYEHVRIYDTITLMGQDVNSTIIDGQGTGTVVTLYTQVTVTGFTIQNSGNTLSYDAGIMNANIPMSYSFTIYGNFLRNNKNGIYVTNFPATITGNTFTNNEFGIYLFDTNDCNINYNNFINNTKNAYFQYFFGLQRITHNNWDHNYWSDWHSVLPRTIKGEKDLVLFVLRPGVAYYIKFPWLNFDWHPAKDPLTSR